MGGVQHPALLGQRHLPLGEPQHPPESADYFSVPEEEIKGMESVLTVVGGKVVYGAGEFGALAPPEIPASPGWSPVARSGGYAASHGEAHKAAA